MLSNGRSLIDLRLKQLKYTGINTWSLRIITDVCRTVHLNIFL